MRTLLAMPEGLQDRMFSPAQRERLAEITGIDVSRTVPDLAAAPDEELAEVEVLVTGWGSPAVDAAALAKILLAGKRTLAQQARYRRERTVGPATAADPGIGNHGGVVGLVGASGSGRWWPSTCAASTSRCWSPTPSRAPSR